MQKKKSGVKNVWKFVPLRGWGGVGRLMANAILNFHFDFLHTSLRGSSDFVTRILLEGFSPLSRSYLLVLPQKESSSSCSRDQNQFMTGTLHISEAVLLPPLQTCPQHGNDLRPTLGSDRGQEQEGEGPRRGRRGWWRPSRWCPRRRGSCPPGGWRGWCRGSSTFRGI